MFIGIDWLWLGGLFLIKLRLMIALRNGVDEVVFLGDQIKQTEVKIIVEDSTKNPDTSKQLILCLGRTFTLFSSFMLAQNKLQLFLQNVSKLHVDFWVCFFKLFERLILDVVIKREEFCAYLGCWRFFVFFLCTLYFFLLDMSSRKSANLPDNSVCRRCFLDKIIVWKGILQSRLLLKPLFLVIIHLAIKSVVTLNEAFIGGLWTFFFFIQARELVGTGSFLCFYQRWFLAVVTWLFLLYLLEVVMAIVGVIRDYISEAFEKFNLLFIEMLRQAFSRSLLRMYTKVILVLAGRQLIPFDHSNFPFYVLIITKN